ncbi:hypothetical protein [Streptomyces dangxiongensis]|uniref:hypothetical protein n=1 Tax=Streptomyces dangxiongensis TaxID=1442032 RepID=UPI0013CE9DEC|nr:hypothetical protein [Streptomyces dangxiongensis]
MVYALGWRPDPFDEVERRITSAASRRGRTSGGRIDCYGKKCGWIGFHTMAGMLADRGQPPEDLEIDIDPIFPQSPVSDPVALGTWTPRAPVDDIEWLRQGMATPHHEQTPRAVRSPSDQEVSGHRAKQHPMRRNLCAPSRRHHPQRGKPGPAECSSGPGCCKACSMPASVPARFSAKLTTARAAPDSTAAVRVNHAGHCFLNNCIATPEGSRKETSTPQARPADPPA